MTVALLVAIVVALILGFTAAWLLMRNRATHALAQGQSLAQVELAMLKERSRAAEEERQHAQARLDELITRFDALRAELEHARDERAQLTERATRVPTLESELHEARSLYQQKQERILTLSKAEAQASNGLAATIGRLEESTASVVCLERELDGTRAALKSADERRAALEVTALQAGALEQQLREQTALSVSLQQDVAQLREDTGRLAASLGAANQSVSEKGARIEVLEQHLADAEMQSIALRAEIADAREATGRTNAELASEQSTLTEVREDLKAERQKRCLSEENASRLNADLAELHARLDAERSQTAEKLEILNRAREQLSDQFKNLASEIFEEKSKRFAEHNQTSIGQLLTLLRDRMAEFKSKVEEIHSRDIEQQALLRAELAQLKELNRKITDEAHELSTALRGQAKKQGNWGELILENVLDRAGLCEGSDYKREVSFNTIEGRKRPDAVVYLPQRKHLVIDAKVSLNAYTRYVNEDDTVLRAQALKEHVAAVSARIQELSDRSYFELPGLNTPEMVFMFIPIESAFVEALRAAEGIFQRAIEHQILVATPTTLLTSLNIVRQLWRFEAQNAHTAELADRASKVYKKLVSFLASMENVGKKLDSAKESFSQAMGQLHSGKGNLIAHAKEFERLGVSVQAQLPEDLVAAAVLGLDRAPDVLVTSQ